MRRHPNLQQKIFQVADPYYKVWFDTSLKTTRIMKPQGSPIQVFKDLWHPKLDLDYVSKCLREPVRRANYVNRVVYYVFTNDGEEGFIPVPKYAPLAFQRPDRNPPIMFLYKVNNRGLFYFK